MGESTLVYWSQENHAPSSLLKTWEQELDDRILEICKLVILCCLYELCGVVSQN
jgi:hypothetical protein